jgi:hypothetical protein
MINKVLTLGCSFTYGEELDNKGTKAWPYLLAKTNNWIAINQGKGGGSNDRNVRLAFDAIDQKYDLIIVAWTVNSRFEVLHNNQFIDISPIYAEKIKLDWAEEYYKLHYDRLYFYKKWLMQVIMMQSYFKQCNQRYLFCNTFGMWSDLREEHFDSYMTQLNNLIVQVDGNNYVDWPRYGMTDWMGDCPKGPGGHPLELGHQRIAERINEHIRNLGWIS